MNSYSQTTFQSPVRVGSASEQAATVVKRAGHAVVSASAPRHLEHARIPANNYFFQLRFHLYVFMFTCDTYIQNWEMVMHAVVNE